MKKSSNSPPRIHQKARWRRILASALVANLLLTALGASFTAQPVQATASIGDTFTCAAGTQWRVLAVDGDGNRLIISEYVHGSGTKYNTTNEFVRWHEMTTTQPIRTAMNNFWTNNVGSDLKAIALPANNLNNDVRTAPGGWNSSENASAGWTSAGTGTPTATNALFILSASEVNRYKAAGSLNTGGSSGGWWLRSPGNTAMYSVAHAYEDSEDAVVALSIAKADSTSFGFRPALWLGTSPTPTTIPNTPTPTTVPITPTSITFPNTPTQLPPHLLNSPTPITFPNTPTQLPPHLLNSPTPITFPNTPTQLPPHLLNSPTPITFVPTNTPLPDHLLTPKVAHNANG